MLKKKKKKKNYMFIFSYICRQQASLYDLVLAECRHYASATG